MRLAAEGATLTLLARDLERLCEVADRLGAGAAACDIRDRGRSTSRSLARRPSAGRSMRSSRTAASGARTKTASKAGLLGLVRSFAELARDDVEVNAICPGWVDTDMAWEGLDGIAAATGGTREDAYREAMREVPLGRMAQPADIAGTVCWLLSDDARGVAGQAIDQNGGAWVG